MAGTPPTITDASVKLSFGAAGVYYGYCTLVDVRYEFTNVQSYQTFTANPDGVTAVAEEITYAAVELQKLIERYYVMPYTGTDFNILLQLREMNAKLAAARLVDRYFMGSEPDMSPWAEDRRSFVESLVLDLSNGNLLWYTPFGDATPQGEAPVYLQASGATVYPNPNAVDPAAQAPIFRIGRSPFQPENM